MGLLSSFKGIITGSDAAKAARRGSRAIRRANNLNIGDFNASFDENSALLQPRVDGETIAANRLLDVIRGNTSVRDDPVFEQDLNESISTVNKSFAPTGKSLSGQRLRALRDADFGAEDRALNRLLTLSAPQSTNNLINLRGNRDSNVANARLGGANAFAAGEIGAANAKTAAFNTLVQLGRTAATAGQGGF